MSQPRVWALINERTGDNAQVLALVEALGYPFEVKHPRYNFLRRFSERLRPTLRSLRKGSRSLFAPPWPDLIVAVGRRSLPAARWVREQSGGATKIVIIGFPRLDPKLVDLVLTTQQYPVPPADNVIVLPLAMSRFSKAPEPDAEERAWFADLERPLRILALGGNSNFWRLPPGLVVEAVRKLQSRPGGLIIAPSRRTPATVLRGVREIIAPSTRMLDGPKPRFAVAMGQADEVYVTADSISMISEAITLGKPTGIVPDAIESVRLCYRHSILPWKAGMLRGRLSGLRRFWAALTDLNLLGTIDQPGTGDPIDSLSIAVPAVRALVEGSVHKPKTGPL